MHINDEKNEWGGRWGSNPRQPESQSGALPTELRPPYQIPLARPARLERATLALEGRCSIQLSYGRNAVLTKNGRGREIRTPDPLLPKQLRYQAALYPDWSYFTHFIKLANFIRSPT